MVSEEGSAGLWLVELEALDWGSTAVEYRVSILLLPLAMLALHSGSHLQRQLRDDASSLDGYESCVRTIEYM